MWWESDLLIMRQYIYRELDHKVLWTINPKYYKIQERNYTSYVYIFIKKVQQLHVHMTLTVHIFRHDVLTFSNYKHDVYTYPIGVQIGLVITNYIQEFGYNFD